MEIEKNKKRIIIILGVVMIILLAVFSIIIVQNIQSKKTKQSDNENQKVEEKEDDEIPIVKKINIIDMDSNSRPIAVMINNHPEARSLQSGLQDAYLVYEMLVEGGLTRLMAIFKDKEPERIGSVRSARHTFLDYVMENDAIYVHFGWSYVAEEQVPKLGINNINGLYDAGFFRDTSLNVAYEHTAFTSMSRIKEVITNKGYRKTTTSKTLLNYTTDEVDLSKSDKAIKADKVNLIFSQGVQNSFIYDSNLKLYRKSVNGVATLDYTTKKQITFKNIIVLKINNWTMSGTILQDFDNIGAGDGYYITDNYSIPIKWSKESRSAKTIYKDLDGNEISVNDGNTYIGIVPLNNSFSLN